MNSALVTRRRLWYAVLLGSGIWLARVSLVPGTVREARLTGINGVGPYYATIAWSYGIGARPVSIIFDFEAGDASGSITTDGEALEAEIPLGVPPGGACCLTVSATYRILGVAHTVVRRFTSVL